MNFEKDKCKVLHAGIISCMDGQMGTMAWGTAIYKPSGSWNVTGRRMNVSSDGKSINTESGQN